MPGDEPPAAYAAAARHADARFAAHFVDEPDASFLMMAAQRDTISCASLPPPCRYKLRLSYRRPFRELMLGIPREAARSTRRDFASPADARR